MKKCLQCDQVYGDDTNFCLSDGSTLVSASISGSFASNSETPTVYGGIGSLNPTVQNIQPPPTAQSNTPFTPPVFYETPNAPIEAKKGNTFLIVLVVGFFALIVGGAVVGLVVYSLVNSDKKDANIATVSNTDQTNKSTPIDKKSDNENLAQNLKEQQDKLAKDKQKLEDDRKALEAKKKETQPPQTPPPSSSTATIFNPPSNIRQSPNGAVLCIVKQRTTINITGSTNIYDNNGMWYYTDVCGRQGVVHSSQIKF